MDITYSNGDVVKIGTIYTMNGQVTTVRFGAVAQRLILAALSLDTAHPVGVIGLLRR